MAEHVLAILVKAIGANKAAKDLKGVDAVVSNIGAKAGKGLRTATHNIAKLGVVAGGVAAAGIIGSVKAAADFESQLNTINTVARKTPAELDKIGDAIRNIAKSTGTPLEDLTQGFYDLVSAGVDASQATKVLVSANTLAIGGLATSAETVDLLTTALNTYGVAAKDQGSESERFADIFAKSIERGKVTAAELAASFAQVGPVAAANKIEIEELAAGYAQLTAKGVPASEAATQMTAAMIALQRRTGPLEKLEKQTGKSYLAIAGKKGLVFAFEQLRKDAAKSGVPLIDLVGRVEGLQFALNTTGPEFASYNENLAAMGDASGTAAAQMGERQKGLNAQIAKLKALAIDAGITIGEKLLPKITPLAEKAVNFLNTHQADIDKFGDKVAAAFDKALAFAEKIPWDTIGAGLETAASWAGKLMDVFLNLPPEVQSTIIALAGLNKLTGGAVGSIIGELGKGLIKGVLGINAGVVNVNGGVVNGGVGGAAGAAGAAGGIKGLAGSIVKGLVGAGVAVVGSNVLSGGVQQGGAMGAAQGALGGAGMIAGGAMLLGPLGAIAGSVAAVGQTFIEVTGQNSALAAGIGQQIQANVAGGAKLTDLKTQLAAVETGINEIQANPLNVLVSGSALDELKASRDLLKMSIAQQESGTNRAVASSERQEAIATQKAAEQAARDSSLLGSTKALDSHTLSGLAGVSAQVQASKAATVTASGAVAAATRATTSAIRDKDLSVTFSPKIVTTVSIRETINTRTTYKQYQKTAS